MNEEMKNLKAWELLDEALFVSSHIKAKDRDKGETDWENVYPISLEETDRMEELVNEAKKVAEDPADEDLFRRVNELENIIDYSRTKHRTWKWAIIGGAILAAAFFWWCTSDNEEDVVKAKSTVAQVEAWTESDTTLTYEKVPDGSLAYYDARYNSAAYYKLYYLAKHKSETESGIKNAEYYKQKADTASTDKAKKAYLKNAESSIKNSDEAKENYKRIEKMGYKDLKKEALKETKKSLGYKNDARNSTLRWTIFLCILIPLYIISGYSYGYVISAHRRRHGILDTIQRWGFAIGGFFFGTGFAMSLLPDYEVVTTYSSGREERHTEMNPGNILMIGLKIGLMIVGAFIFSFICVLIMTIQTISGLKDNFNWQPLINKTKEQVHKFNKK